MKVIPLFKNESSLIKRAAKNNRKAQQQLFQQHSGKMLSVCRMYIRDREQAESVMLAGFLKVFSHLKDFKAEGSFEGWIRRIMVREAISFLRRNKEMRFSEDIIKGSEESFNDIEANINADHIQRLIDALPEGYKVVFVMYAIEGYKHREIAQILKIDSGTSKSQLFKARKMLQKQLETLKKEDYVTNQI